MLSMFRIIETPDNAKNYDQTFNGRPRTPSPQPTARSFDHLWTPSAVTLPPDQFGIDLNPDPTDIKAIQAAAFESSRQNYEEQKARSRARALSRVDKGDPTDPTSYAARDLNKVYTHTEKSGYKFWVSGNLSSFEKTSG